MFILTQRVNIGYKWHHTSTYIFDLMETFKDPNETGFTKIARII